MMKKTITICIVFLISILHSNAQTIYIRCSADALIYINAGSYCASWQTSNYGASSMLQAAEWTWFGAGCDTGSARSILYFDMNIPLDNHCIYDNKAMLYLYYPTGSAEVHQYLGNATDNQFYIQRITYIWGEMTVTWVNQPSVTTAGQVTVPSSIQDSSTQDYQVGLSGMVYEWICNSVANYGIRLVMVHEWAPYRRVTFASREFSDTTKCPTLALEYAYIEATAPDSVNSGNSFTITCTLNNAANPVNYQFQWIHLNSGTNYSSQTVLNPATIIGMNTYVVNVTNPWCQSASDTVYVFVTQPTSVNNSIHKNLIRIYPNTANDKITIESSTIKIDEMVSILNVQGQLILQQEMNHEKTEIDISDLPAGLYFVRVESEEGFMVKKVVKE